MNPHLAVFHLVTILFGILAWDNVSAQTSKICSSNQKEITTDVKPEKSETNTREPSSKIMTTAKVRGQTIVVSFHKLPATETPKKGTIISLCGGPGIPCHGTRPQFHSSQYDVITFDYLGIGENSRYNDAELMSIEGQGEAVAAIVDSLTSDVVILGSSFGTSVATVAASILTKASAGPPLKEPHLRAWQTEKSRLPFTGGCSRKPSLR